MRDPIDRLLEEHRAIRARVAGLRRAVAELNRRGEQALPEVMPTLEDVSAMMSSDLATHARREDEGLFPALEAVFGDPGGPTRVMREEHRAIHGQAERFRDTLRELNEVEHPAIVAAGARLRTLAGAGGSAADLRVIGATILELIDLHFAKEEDILFPMARQLLGPEAMAAVARRMEALDAGIQAT